MWDIQELASFAARGLVAMFDADRQLFCHRLLATKQGLVREGVSPRYTVMTLLGLKELDSAGLGLPFDIRAIYRSLIRDTKWIQGVGDLGLLIWIAAAIEPNHLGDLFRTFDCETALDHFSDARERRTMELAWFLSGLAHAAETCPELVSTLTDPSMETYRRIEKNQAECGLFCHMSPEKSFLGRLRGHIGSFADQVYPMYAISKFAKAFHLEGPLGLALKCATAICGAQGKAGQWWWLYDVRSGRVSSRYPIYSVHQHGMAPMGLFAVEEATGKSFRESIDRGLRWIYGVNELGFDMRDVTQGVIWRCVLPRNRQAKLWEMVLSAVRPINHDTQVRSLEVMYEQRPYEFGWLLFAFARNFRTGHLVTVSSE
jgi:hypothetical protein